VYATRVEPSSVQLVSKSSPGLLQTVSASFSPCSPSLSSSRILSFSAASCIYAGSSSAAGSQSHSYIEGVLLDPHPPLKQGQRSVAAPSLLQALHPPAAGQIPVQEEESSAGRASSPEDLLTACVAQEPPPILAQVEPIAEEMCCLLLWSSFSVSVLVRRSMQEQPAVHIHSKLLHGLQVHTLLCVLHLTEEQP